MSYVQQKIQIHLNFTRTNILAYLSGNIDVENDKINQWDQLFRSIVKDINLENKTCLITGANGSVGLELTRCLSLRDCNVLMACRNIYKATRDTKDFCEKSERLSFYDLNLASLLSVKECANRIRRNEKKIDIVILNAATFGIPWSLTEDTLETTFQVNCLSQYYLLLLLSTTLAPDARVVFTSAESHRNIKWPNKDMPIPNVDDLSLPKYEYTSIKSYNISKLCGILLVHYLSDHWSSTERSVFCAHPGSFIRTGLCRNWWFYEMLYFAMLPFTKSIVQGASTIIYCATSPELKGSTAAYFKDCKPCDESDLAKNFCMSYRVHDLIIEILRERVTDFDNILSDFKSTSSKTV
ncbi:WW domain-containing oxidoreductase-like [Bicyclus anynana]|uniref:WW domain-containing oxidoreductase-like n=1 Tax=Bicyclus anynana TaxID=110368 RepID=A0ABM3M6I9_BICAN|nr:WW domain-containing oxidoreductase-like [Bicyclus anynana]